MILYTMIKAHCIFTSITVYRNLLFGTMEGGGGKKDSKENFFM